MSINYIVIENEQQKKDHLHVTVYLFSYLCIYYFLYFVLSFASFVFGSVELQPCSSPVSVLAYS